MLENWTIVDLVVAAGSIVTIIPTIISTFFIVSQQEAIIIERLGKFNRVCFAGLHFKWPIIEKRVHETSLRIEQLDIKPEVKTKDDVFAIMPMSIQYCVTPDKVYDSYYKLEDPEQQMEAYALDALRSETPSLTLDELYSQKDHIAVGMQSQLSDAMDEFGFTIRKILAKDVEPDSKVKEAMNNINAAQRDQVAAKATGEASRILQVAKAEGEAEASRLQGEGIAAKRRAILNGYQKSMEEFKETMGLKSEEVMNYVLTSQYMETLKEVADNSNTNTIFMDSSANAPMNLQKQILSAMRATLPKSVE